jgi:hypothetical protein
MAILPEGNMGKSRTLNDKERKLLSALIVGTPRADHLLKSLDDALFEDMDDGGMGGLRVCKPDGHPRAFGEKLAEKEFADVDGIPVVIALNLDDTGELYELDIWKVDFSPLKRFPALDE